MSRLARPLPIGALLVLSLAIWLPRLRGPIDLRWDGGTYYVLGTSLAEGRGYRLLNEPGEIEAVQYPPLLPAIVAVHQWILGSSDPMIVGHWLRLTFFVMFLVSVLATYALLERVLPPAWAFVAVSMCVLHLFSMFLSELLFAELPFLLASLLFVFWSGVGSPRERPFLSGLCATLAYLLRTAGVALLIAWVAESFLRREFRRVVIRGAIALVPIVGWQAYIAGVQAGASYATPAYPYQRAEYVFYNVTYASNLSLRDPFRPELGKASFRDLAVRVARNLTRLPQSIGEAVSADKGDWHNLLARLPGAQLRAGTYVRSWAVPVALTGLGILVLIGVALQLGGSGRLMGLYVLAYCGTVCLTPWPAQWRRYWFPLAPLLVLALLQCLLWVGRRAILTGSAPRSTSGSDAAGRGRRRRARRGAVHRTSCISHDPRRCRASRPARIAGAVLAVLLRSTGPRARCGSRVAARARASRRCGGQRHAPLGTPAHRDEDGGASLRAGPI